MNSTLLHFLNDENSKSFQSLNEINVFMSNWKIQAETLSERNDKRIRKRRRKYDGISTNNGGSVSRRLRTIQQYKHRRTREGIEMARTITEFGKWSANLSRNSIELLFF